MVDELDQAIGTVLSIYKEQGMLDNTLVLFMSDNGGLILPGPEETHTLIQKIGITLDEWFDRPVPIPGLEFIASNALDGGSDNTPLLGGKGMATEGGVRVPAAIWWPSNLKKRHHTQPMTIADVLPTLLDAIGASDAIPDDLDGRSQLEALNGRVSEHPDYAVSGLFSGQAIYRWPWKLIDTESPQLFNILEDPLEQTDLAATESERVTKCGNDCLHGALPKTQRSRFSMYCLIPTPLVVRKTEDCPGPRSHLIRSRSPLSSHDLKAHHNMPGAKTRLHLVNHDACLRRFVSDLSF